MRASRSWSWCHQSVAVRCLLAGYVLIECAALAQETEKSPAGASQGEANRKPDATSPEKAPSLSIVIPDEPKTVNPDKFYPEKLTKKVTVQFKGNSISEVARWLQENQSLDVIIDEKAMADEGISPFETISVQLDDAPVYLILDQLQEYLLNWVFEDGALVITTRTAAEEIMSTVSYNIGDLLDDGHKTQQILRAIQGCLSGKWENRDGDGGQIVLLGDVLFVRQTHRVHYEIVALLEAIRRHGRRTFVLDPPEHEELREKLKHLVTVNFDNISLANAIDEISRQAEAGIWIDQKSLADEGISIHTPISLRATGVSVQSALRRILSGLLLASEIENGLIKITTQTAEREHMKTAVFDVRDLCRNQSESDALSRAIPTQTGGLWESMDGDGGMLIAPKPGVLVVRQNARQLDEVLMLLENYRTALRNSKFRLEESDGPKSIVTKYYRLQKDVALDVEKILPELVVPESWKSASRPDAPGTIRVVSSPSELLNGVITVPGTGTPDTRKPTETFLIPKAVLVVRQTRENHEAIETVLHKIEFGDGRTSSNRTMPSGGMGGMGGGMGGMGGGGMGGGAMGGMGGGFGGGFFCVPAK